MHRDSVSCALDARFWNAAVIAATVSVGNMGKKLPAYSPPAMGWILRCCFFVPRKMAKMLENANDIFSATALHATSAVSLKSGFITWITQIGWPLLV